MDEGRKRAYRYLLYVAMLDIRVVCQPRDPATLNPDTLWEHYQRSLRAGALANWLHNLASGSGRDFQGFNEDEFWDGYGRYRSRFPVGGFDYRQAFEDELRR